MSEITRSPTDPALEPTRGAPDDGDAITREARPLPDGERDACGIGFIANVDGEATHGVLEDGLTALANLEHRGAVAADGATGDGAGVLTQLPDAFFRDVLDEAGIAHREDRALAVGVLFLPQDEDDAEAVRELVEARLEAAPLEHRAWRPVPTDASVLGDKARRACPRIEQVIVQPDRDLDGEALERELFLLRRRIEQDARGADLRLHVPSFSGRTIVYKGLMVASQVDRFYPDLADTRYRTAICVFHQRYSTNTTPSWPRAQPFRLIGHNGEINTLTGNVNSTRAREARLASTPWGDQAQALAPIIDETGSDSGMLDNVLELMVRSGRDPLEALLAMIPDVHETADLPEPLAAFFRFHERAIEPWDGPAAIVLTDGRYAHAALDRNGLRPLRYWLTEDGRAIVASEAGVVPTESTQITEKGRLGPGQRIAIDTAAGDVLRDGEVKHRIADAAPYEAWADAAVVEPPEPETLLEDRDPRWDDEALTVHQRTFDYGEETVSTVLEPMAYEAQPAVYSMGDDTPLAVLSAKPQLLHRYFKQRFAQVTNPPIDPLREERVMSLTVHLGPDPGWLAPRAPERVQVRLDSPVLTPARFAWLTEAPPEGIEISRLDATFPARAVEQGLQGAIERLEREAVQAVEAGATVLVLSDVGIDAEHAQVPMLLATSAVHHRLVDAGLRPEVGLVVDTGEVREDHHLACLVGYGADAVHPRLAYRSVEAMAREDPREAGLSREDAVARYTAGLEKGLRKVLSKMGISTVASYRGAQVFEILGLDAELVERFFPRTHARLGGAGLATLARDAAWLHAQAFQAGHVLEQRGFYRYRTEGEYHAYNPDVFTALHEAVEERDPEAFDRYAQAVDQRPPCTVRDLLEIDPIGEPVPLDEVEPAEAIATRFATGAMSHGSISAETHETIAIAMNRLGGKSNTGEGGEDPERFTPYETDRPDRSLADWHPTAGDDPNSAIKQVASGRFGVTPAYLASARELEIKMAQGSKPGEGGQIPGHKVSEEIARIRRSTPGVPLISPPPHHDIYSIEDLAQLIFDLKRVNAKARVAVKLVALSGVGTIATGVAKGHADTIQISGHDGGTGASPLSSIKHAGVPWELGLAQAQRRLVEEDLRGRVKLRVDGGLKTGRDVLIAALLGAEAFGFGTAALVASGCVMTRQCHLNTCPVGIATQDPELRERFPGTPDRVVAFFLFVAEQIRHLLSRMGARSLDEVIGRTDLLAAREVDLPRVDGVDVAALIEDPDPTGEHAHRCRERANDPPEPQTPLDQRVLEAARPAIEGTPVPPQRFTITNRDRTVGARLAGQSALARVNGADPAAVQLTFEGTAGQSFGAFTTEGTQLVIEGEAQDYVGKGMHGGELVLVPPEGPFAETGVPIMGNTVLYGATGGQLYAAGAAGERFCVRNSGAIAVVEGCGDHAFEYMTGGVAVVLGEVGDNVGAGMSGGVAFVHDPDGALPGKHNDQMTRLAEVPREGREARLLYHLLERHHQLTGSEASGELLGAWPACLDAFCLVIPGATEDDEAPGSAVPEPSSLLAASLDA